MLQVDDTDALVKLIEQLVEKYGSYQKVVDACPLPINKSRLNYWMESGSNLKRFLAFVLWARDDMNLSNDQLVRNLEIEAKKEMKERMRRK